MTNDGFCPDCGWDVVACECDHCHEFGEDTCMCEVVCFRGIDTDDDELWGSTP
jgi:hypothetical protein